MEFIVSSQKLKENQERAFQKEKEDKKAKSDEKWNDFEKFAIGFAAGLTYVVVVMQILL